MIKGRAFLADASARDLGPPGGHLTIDYSHSWLGTYTGIVVITVAALPFAMVTVWAIGRRRCRSGVAPSWAWRMSLAEVGIVVGTVPWVAMTMLPGSRPGAGTSEVSLVPLRDLLTMPMYQIAGNLLIFAAVGFLLPVRFAGMASLRRILALAAAGSVLIETAQFVLPLDRVFSVDDVLLNTAGAGLAALASHRWWRTRPAPSEPDSSPSGIGLPTDTSPTARPMPPHQGRTPAHTFVRVHHDHSRGVS